MDMDVTRIKNAWAGFTEDGHSEIVIFHGSDISPMNKLHQRWHRGQFLHALSNGVRIFKIRQQKDVQILILKYRFDQIFQFFC